VCVCVCVCVCAGQVRVWALDTLAPAWATRRPGAAVHCLAAVGGELWGGVGREVVSWGPP
jgi:hypothetical protein